MLFGIPYHRRQIAYLLGDVFVALLALTLGHVLRFGMGSEASRFNEILTTTTGASAVFVGTLVGALYVADAYGTARNFRRPDELVRLWLAIGAALVGQMVLFYALPNWWWGRGVAGLSCLSFAVLVSAWRYLVCTVRPTTQARTRTLIVGAGRAGRAMAAVLSADPEHLRAHDLRGFIDDAVQADAATPPVLGTGDDLAQLVEAHRIGLVIVAVRGGLRPELAADLLAIKARGIDVQDMPSVYKRLTGKLPILHMADTWLLFGPAFSGQNRVAALSQRAADVVLGGIGLLLTTPVVLVAGLAVKLESPGPALYTQVRVGQGGRPFTIIKLRTMRQDAEQGTGAVWSQGAGDPRVTRVGRLLRRSRIDELPQFWNIVRGDMSLVGPRPERPPFVEQLQASIPFYSLRFSVKPGATGWAQVMYRYGASEEDAAEKLRFELFAIQEMNPLLYALIVLKTVQTVLFKPGS